MNNPLTRSGFVKTYDGCSLAYEAVGSGPVFLCCNGLGVSTFFWRYLKACFSNRMTFVTWDYRGHGKSETPEDLDTLTVENCARDARLVLDHLGLGAAVLAGHSMGCQVILEYSRMYPEQTLGLIPMFGTFGSPLKTFFDSDLVEKIFPLIFQAGTKFDSRRLIEKLYNTEVLYRGASLLGIINGQYCSREDMEPYFAHLRALDPRVFLHLTKHAGTHTTLQHLSQIKAPTLIIAGDRDYFTPLHLSRKMNNLIKNSEMLIIKKGSHAAIVEHPELINLRVEKFFKERLQIL